MPIKKTKAVDAKFQKAMVEFYNAIKSNNELVQKLLEIGFSLESIDVLGIKKLDFDTEFHEANPGLNMQYSGFKATGGGGLDLPFLTVEQLQQMFSAITGTPLAANVTEFNQFLARIQVRTNIINGRIASIRRPVLAEFLPSELPSDSRLVETFSLVVSQLAQRSGVLNVYMPNTRTDRTPPALPPGSTDPVTSSKKLKELINKTQKSPDQIHKIRQLLIAIINIICHGSDDIKERFKAKVRELLAGARTETTAFSNVIGNFLSREALSLGDEYKGRTTEVKGNEEITSTKLGLIIGLIKQYLQQLGFYFGGVVFDIDDPNGPRYDPNLNSQPIPDQALPIDQRNYDPDTQKTPNEQLEARATAVFNRIIANIKQRGDYTGDTLGVVIDIIQSIYSKLQKNYSTADEEKAYNDILTLYNQIIIAINQRLKTEPTSIGESFQSRALNLFRRIYDGIQRPVNVVIDGVSTNRDFLMDLAKLVLVPNPDRVRKVINEILDEFRLSQSGQIVPPTSSLARDPPTTNTTTTTTTTTTTIAPATAPATTPQVTTAPATTPQVTTAEVPTPQPTSTFGTSTYINNLVDLNVTTNMTEQDAKQIEQDRQAEEKRRTLSAQKKIENYKMLVLATKYASTIEKEDLTEAESKEATDIAVRYYNQSRLFDRALENKYDSDSDDSINSDDLDYDNMDYSDVPLLGVGEANRPPQPSRISAIRERLPNMPNMSNIRARLPNRPNMPRITLPRVPAPRMPAGWANNFRLTRQYLYVTNNNVVRMFNDHNDALLYAQQDDGVNVDAVRIVTRYGLYYRTGTPVPKSRSRPRSNIPQLPAGMGGGDGGDPDDDPNNDPDAFEDPDWNGDPDLRNAYNNNERFRGLTAKQWAKLLAVIFVLSTGAVTIDDLIKSEQDINKDGTTSPPSGGGGGGGDSGGTSSVPRVPTKPPSTGGGGGGGGKPDDNFFPDQYSKLNHSELWDSIGLGSVIDTYNGYVDQYNKSRKDKSLTNADIKILNKKITDFYGKFAEATNTPTLPELVKARSIYDNLRKEYDKASENGLSFSSIIMLYKNLRDAANHVDDLTSKYLDIENGLFGTAKSKDDSDVTIDDHDDAFANITTKANTSMGGKAKALVDPGSKILSKGMIERIARKLNNQANADQGVNEELQRFDAFSMVKDYDYPTGLGTIEDNPLMRRNKEYEIKQYLTANPNPRPYNVPSRERLERVSKTDGTQYFMAIQNTNGVHENPNYVPMGKEVKFSNPNDICGSKFEKSKLFNPPVAPKKKNVPTGSNMIRSGPYQGVNVDQYYQYGSVEYKHNEKFNKYPLTDMQPDQKPKQHYKIAAKLIKKSRVPDTYSLK